MSDSENRNKRIQFLLNTIPNLTDGQIRWLESFVIQFNRPHKFTRNSKSDLVDDTILQDFGDALRMNHCFSQEPFSKDKFEYVLEQVLNINGIGAKRAPKGNPGHDMTIKKERFSLKTQADKAINVDEIHISKFHELGKGKWTNEIEDLYGLREQFLEHMESYERILSLRAISKPPDNWHYELVEIPKDLLLEARDGVFEMMFESKQMPKPGYCRVYDDKSKDLFGKSSKKKFELYFDGGTERKLQIKHLNKSVCMVHADWIFSSETL